MDDILDLLTNGDEVAEETIETAGEEPDNQEIASENADEAAAEETPDEKPEEPIEEAQEQAQAEESDDPDIAAVLASETSDARVTALEAKIAELSAQLQTATKEPEKPFEFVSEEEFDEIMQDRDRFNAKLNAVAMQAAQAALAQSQQIMAQQMQLQQTVNDFYSVNADLQAHKDTVRQMSEKLIRQNPDISYEQLLDKAAKATRMLKKLPTPITAGKKGAVKPPSLPSVKARPGKPAATTAKTKMQLDVDFLLDDAVGI